MGIKSTVVKVWNQVFETAEQKLDGNKALNADISIRKREKIVEGMHEQLIKSKANSKLMATRKVEAQASLDKYELVLNSTLKAKGTKEEVTAALLGVDGAKTELAHVTKEVANDEIFVAKVSKDFFKAKSLVEKERKDLKNLKLKLKSIELNKALVESGTGLTFDNKEMGSLTELKDSIAHEERLMEAGEEVLGELTGQTVDAKAEQIDLDARVKELMANNE